MSKLFDWKLCVLYTVVFWSVANLCLKHASDNLDWRISTLFWMLGSFFSSCVTFIFLRKYFVKPNKACIASAFSGFVCALSIGVASVLYSICDASKIAPIMGLATPLSGVVCIFLFKEKLTLRIVLGIICAGLCIYLLG
ncbi:MAG: hypothetical protein KBT47_02060 [Armatimonadetes bacterium]|nr:hypothetical protein [Candidatus Hippobium faecium]